MSDYKVYISGKITGLTEEEAKENFSIAEAEVFGFGSTPVNPMTLPHEHGKTWQEYMKEDIKALLDCNAIYLLRNWSDSKGAKLEFEIAKSLGLEIMAQS